MEFHIYRTHVLKGWNHSEMDGSQIPIPYIHCSKIDQTTIRGKSRNYSVPVKGMVDKLNCRLPESSIEIPTSKTVLHLLDIQDTGDRVRRLN